jgi:acetyltransferase-like isoleucine patch superfamily enzyme
MQQYKNIRAKEIIIGNNCTIADDVQIDVRGTFQIGDCSIIKSGTTIQCEEFIAGEYLYMSKQVEVGRGGFNNQEAIVCIGDHVGIFENVLINPNSPVTIGNDVGIGTEVMIWTHGAWLDITQGFPADFGPVTIGDNVWIPARTIMLPNTSIGSNTVIGIGSIITKPIPSNVMAAGTPCKVIKENYYPKKLSAQELENLISPIINYWKEILCPQKGIEDVELNFDATSNIIYLKHHTKTTQFDVIQKTMIGDFTSESEDLRDFLRRRGIKIFTGKPFVSMKKI